MNINLNLKAIELLNNIANSVYERENNGVNLCFSIKEVKVVEEWLNQFINEKNENFLN